MTTKEELVMSVKEWIKADNEIKLLQAEIKKRRIHKNKLSETINNHKLKLNNYEIFDCYENVTDEDNANTILRSRKNSSIYKGLEFVKSN